MNGKIKTILLVVLLVVVAGVGLYKTEKSHEAKQKALVIQEQQVAVAKENKAKALEAQKEAYEKQQEQNQGSQVVGTQTYPDGELINIANENYAQFMKNNNNYNFESILNRQSNGDLLTVTFSATCNGNPQTITMTFKSVNSVVRIVGNNA
ncbi:MAG: hypothetical protein ACRCWG_00705 [Sarcina sp.]